MSPADDGLHRGLEIVGALIVVVMVVSVLLQGQIAASISCGILSSIDDVVAVEKSPSENSADCDQSATASAGTDAASLASPGLASAETARGADSAAREAAAESAAADGAVVENAAEQDHVHDLLGETGPAFRPGVADSRTRSLPTRVAPDKFDARDLLLGRGNLLGQADRLVVGLSNTVYTREETSDILSGAGAPFAIPAEPADSYEDGEPLGPGVGDPVTAAVERDYASLLSSLPQIMGPAAAARFATCRYPSVVVGNSESSSQGIHNRAGTIFIQREADPETRYAVLAHEFAHAMFFCAQNVERSSVGDTNQGSGLNEAQAYYFGNLASWFVNQKPFSPNYGSYSFCDTVDPERVHRLGRPVTGVFIDLERQLDLLVGAGEAQRRMGAFHAAVLLSGNLQSFLALRTEMYAAGPDVGISKAMIDAAFTSLDFDTWFSGDCAQGYGPRGLLRPQPLP